MSREQMKAEIAGFLRTRDQHGLNRYMAKVGFGLLPRDVPAEAVAGIAVEALREQPSEVQAWWDAPCDLPGCVTHHDHL